MVKNLLKTAFYVGLITTPLGAIGIVLFTQIALGIAIDFRPIIIAFLGGEIIYFFNRYKERGGNDYRKKMAKNSIAKLLLMVFSILFIIFLLILSPNKNFLIAGFSIIILGILYTVIFKKIPLIGFKNFFVALIWASITFLSAFAVNKPFNSSVLIAVFLFVIFNTFAHEVLLDIRDKEDDKLEGILTLPNHISVRKLKLIVITFSALSLMALYPLANVSKNSSTFALIFSFSFIYNVYIFEKLKKPTTKNHLSLEPLLDVAKMLWPIQLLICKII